MPEELGSAGSRGIHRSTVEWIDTDAAGIHHNTAIVRWVESAEAALMRAHGLQQQYFPQAPRVRYLVDFEGPLRFGQELTATVTLTRIGTSSMDFSFEVWGERFAGQPRRRAAVGKYVTVHIRGDHAGDAPARSTPWPEEWVAVLRAEVPA